MKPTITPTRNGFIANVAGTALGPFPTRLDAQKAITAYLQQTSKKRSPFFDFIRFITGK